MAQNLNPDHERIRENELARFDVAKRRSLRDFRFYEHERATQIEYIAWKPENASRRTEMLATAKAVRERAESEYAQAIERIRENELARFDAAKRKV